MADVKISQLPAATTPLDGTELTPIVQSGTTKRVSVANLTVGRALTASSLTLSTPLSAANGGTGLTSLGTGIATFLGTPTSANLAAAVTDETGTGALVFGTTPTFTTSALFPAGTVGAPGISVSGDTDTGIYFPAADTIGFATNGAASMRLDASGNLGLGVTPSAWGSFSKAFESAGGFGTYLTNANSNAAGLVSNAYRTNSNWIYKTTDVASVYETFGGGHYWRTASSGTAGNAITFTQAMTLDANGTFRVKGAGTAGSTDAFLVDGGAPASAARIDSSGNLLVGTTSPVGNAKVVSADGYNSRSVDLTLNATSTVTVPDGCICCISSGGFAGDTAVFSIKSSGGSQGTYALIQGTAGNIGFGTTSNPSTGTRLNLWISATNTLSISDVGQGARTIYLTFFSSGA